jgi:hypothetical protein
MTEQYKSLVNWYYIEDWSDYPGPKGRVVPNIEGYDNPSDYDGAELYISQGTIGDKEGNLFIDEKGNDVPFNSEYFEKTNPLKENKMNKETLRMQMLAGIITEDEMAKQTNDVVMKNWDATNKAQLDDYKENGPKDIRIGDNNFKIIKYFMDSNKVPTIEIVNTKTNQVHFIYLSIVWAGFQNYSALGSAGREELMNKYNLA